LRTPVTSIKALSKIILDDYARLDEERRTAYLQIIVNESDRISRLINQVLDIEKLRSEEPVQQMEQLELTEIVLHAVDGVQQLLTERNIKCTITPTNLSLPVNGNRDKLIQVVVNLLSNALKFCNQQEGRIDIHLKQKDRFVFLGIRDNGPGIPAQARQLIFEQFTQLHSKEQGKPHGTGLGLYITKKIVEQHHGSIRVESEPGHGALFEIILPLSNDEPLDRV